jgi:hypothetical protein
MISGNWCGGWQHRSAVLDVGSRLHTTVRARCFRLEESQPWQSRAILTVVAVVVIAGLIWEFRHVKFYSARIKKDK